MIAKAQGCALTPHAQLRTSPCGRKLNQRPWRRPPGTRNWTRADQWANVPCGILKEGGESLRKMERDVKEEEGKLGRNRVLTPTALRNKRVEKTADRKVQSQWQMRQTGQHEALELAQESGSRE